MLTFLHILIKSSKLEKIAYIFLPPSVPYLLPAFSYTVHHYHKHSIVDYLATPERKENGHVSTIIYHRRTNFTGGKLY